MEGQPLPPPSALKRKILIKNKRLKPEVEKVELELFLQGKFEAKDEVVEDASGAPAPPPAEAPPPVSAVPCKNTLIQAILGTCSKLHQLSREISFSILIFPYSEVQTTVIKLFADVNE